MGKEVIKIEKDDNLSFDTICYKIKLIDSSRFMVSSLSNLTESFNEAIHKIKSKDCDCFLKYESVK